MKTCQAFVVYGQITRMAVVQFTWTSMKYYFIIRILFLWHHQCSWCCTKRFPIIWNLKYNFCLCGSRTVKRGNTGGIPEAIVTWELMKQVMPWDLFSVMLSWISVIQGEATGCFWGRHNGCWWSFVRWWQRKRNKEGPKRALFWHYPHGIETPAASLFLVLWRWCKQGKNPCLL